MGDSDGFSRLTASTLRILLWSLLLVQRSWLKCQATYDHVAGQEGSWDKGLA